jgi:hypothetical protein
MNKLRYNAIGFVVSALMFLPVHLSTAHADDDWEDRWEDYQEELEDRREEERERLEEWREDRAEVLEDRREHRVIVQRENWRPRNRSTHYWQYDEELPPPRRYTQEQRYYREPAYRDDYRGDVYHDDDVYVDEPPVYDYYSRPQPRYYGTSRFGYSEYGRERSVRVGPVQVFWNR